MIRLYAFLPSFTGQILAAKKIADVDHILKNMYFSYGYNHQEFTWLSQSTLSHDLFINSLSEDRNGEVVVLSGFPEAGRGLLLKNENVRPILKIFEDIQKATNAPMLPSSDILTLILNFLRLSYENGYDVLSTSTLGWNYGD